MVRSKVPAAVAGLSLLALASTLCAQYTASILQPPGAAESFIKYARSGQQTGFGSGALITGGNTHAFLWTGGPFVVDLQPPASTTFGNPPAPISGSFSYGTAGGQQVGFCIAGLVDAACLWNSTADSIVFLNTPDMERAVAYGTDGVHQVGSARLFGAFFTHAQAWTGTAQSVVDIHPTQPGFDESTAQRVTNGRAAGYLVDDVGFYAGAVWKTLSPNDVLILRTPDQLESVVNDVRGSVAGGNGYPDGGAWHALLWTDLDSPSGPTTTDIHPDGYFTSFIQAINDTKQVGLASTARDADGNNNEHAAVWSGTAASFVDLHAALQAIAPAYTDSQASGIDDDGTIYGYATVNGTNFTSVKWTLATTGLCCRGSTCAANVAQAACVPVAGAGASFISTGTCNANNNASSPCCLADYNKANGVGVQDILDYVSGWLNASIYADINGNGTSTPTVQDLLDFFTAWLSGSCS